MKIDGQEISPRKLTEKILFKNWKMLETDKDLTVMRITSTGKKNGKVMLYEFTLLDHHDERLNASSMSRTTGYTATMITRLILEEKFDEIGIIPPEKLGMNESHYNYIVNGLKNKGININEKTREYHKVHSNI